MKEQRHPHPHVDPRQPRNETAPGTNPPVFVWKPLGGEREFRLTVARDRDFADVCLDLRELRDPTVLPEKAFPRGRYYWKWSAGARVSEVFAFEVTPEAAVVEVPPAREWLKRFPAQHPRIYIRPEEVPALRQSRREQRAAPWRSLEARADELLLEDHEMEEPPFLPDRTGTYQKRFEVWHGVMVDSRRFVKGAQTLALAYLASGEVRYAQAACRRMASVSRWDPTGSSHIAHNDEAHMSVIWDGPQACDWVWEQFTDEQRDAVIEQFRRRGRINFEHMHDRGMYGVSRFDSHAGREVVFLAQIAFVFHEHILEAGEWLEWLRPVLCGLWPIWAGDDGGWAEGPSYSTAYVGIMTMFATTLKRGAGIDLYRRPFWKNHSRWRQYCVPPYAEWLGFGDNGIQTARVIRTNADLVEVIDHEAGANELAGYVAACREANPHPPDTPEDVPPQKYLAPTEGARRRPKSTRRICRVFGRAGWAAIRTHLDDPSRDVAFLFRCSPLGAISHSHANNNDFILHAAGEVLAMPSGYYDGYGSGHHAHWVWQTKSHNCLTLSDAGQLVRSHDSVGAIENAFEDELLVYFRGTADASYDRARRCRRHVFFLKPHACFVLIDEFAAAAGIACAMQWNIHSFNPFAVDEDKRAFLLEREGSSLAGHFLYHGEAFFSLSEGWDPPPMPRRDLGRWPQQYNLRFSIAGMAPRRNLGVVLAAGHARLARAEVVTETAAPAEVARIGADRVLVNQGGMMEYESLRSEALAVLVIHGHKYELTDEGLNP